MKAKTANICATIFSLFMGTCLILGLISAIGFIIGLIIGGEAAAGICSFIEDYIFPVVYILGSTSAVFGMLKMYLSKEKTFVLEKNEKNDDDLPD